ncbi:MAG TPA: nicotinate phosphoribosyltransferase [Candidatus Methanoperedenaceae archaeon]|nr:nicotinate phosphoribosyltransferase [Candidatus Methanoperedenaceae archaeon]
MKFYIATEDDIMSGGTTDVYFTRTMEILKAFDMTGLHVIADFTTSSLPGGWDWGIFCGLSEIAHLLAGRDIDLYAMPEGTVFRPRTKKGVLVPVMYAEGKYGEFCIFETPMLGLICQASGIATATARCRMAAGNATLISFGTRRMHPALAPVIDRYAFIGGCDGVSSLAGAEALGEKPMGTMPHALIICFGDQKKAFAAFDKVISEDVPRIALVDTYCDEKAEAIMACEAVKNLAGVRLDTPRSRRGSFVDLLREVRWELDLRGYGHVRIFVSGGLDESTIAELARAGADGFGVGTAISNAATVDFGMDIVEKEGKPVAKRGKFGGRKFVYRCPECFEFEVRGRDEETVCGCGTRMEPMLEKHIEGGRLIKPLPDVHDMRKRVLEQLEKIGSIT